MQTSPGFYRLTHTDLLEIRISESTQDERVEALCRLLESGKLAASVVVRGGLRKVMEAGK